MAFIELRYSFTGEVVFIIQYSDYIEYSEVFAQIVLQSLIASTCFMYLNWVL